MKLKDWKIPYARPSISPSLASAGFTPLLSAVLALRGISSAEDAKTLIYGSGAWLLDPMLIKGMGAAVKRIRAAVNGVMAQDAASLKDGDETAYFPPVTGG